MRAHGDVHGENLGKKHVDILAKQGAHDLDRLGDASPGYVLCLREVPGFVTSAVAAAAHASATASAALPAVPAVPGFAPAATAAGPAAAAATVAGAVPAAAAAVATTAVVAGDDAPIHLPVGDDWAWLADVQLPDVNTRATIFSLPTKTSELYGEVYAYVLALHGAPQPSAAQRALAPKLLDAHPFLLLSPLGCTGQ
eukprot:SAG11_NODE_200_length_12606_cov_51.874550_12_plen_197_part_00